MLQVSQDTRPSGRQTMNTGMNAGHQAMPVPKPQIRISQSAVSNDFTARRFENEILKSGSNWTIQRG